MVPWHGAAVQVVVASAISTVVTCNRFGHPARSDRSSLGKGFGATFHLGSCFIFLPTKWNAKSSVMA